MRSRPGLRPRTPVEKLTALPISHSWISGGRFAEARHIGEMSGRKGERKKGKKEEGEVWGLGDKTPRIQRTKRSWSSQSVRRKQVSSESCSKWQPAHVALGCSGKHASVRPNSIESAQNNRMNRSVPWFDTAGVAFSCVSVLRLFQVVENPTAARIIRHANEVRLYAVQCVMISPPVYVRPFGKWRPRSLRFPSKVRDCFHP